MNIRIDKTKIKDYEIESYKNKCNEALDSIWTQTWLTRSVTKADKQVLSQIEEVAETIKRQKKNVVVVTSGEIRKLVKAVKGILPEEDDGVKVTIMGDSFSPYDYVKILNENDNKEFILLVITGKDDPVSVKGAYATLKQVLVSGFGLERAAEDIFVIASDKENSIAVDAQGNSCTTIYYPSDIPELYCGGTEPVLLILSLMGYDTEKYLDGFRDMLSSPAWDLDAADYSIAKAMAYKEGCESRVIYMQRQLEDFASWFADTECLDGSKAVMLPGEKTDGERKVFNTYLSIERDEDDIMMPFFEGCNEDGSLNLLMNETGDRYFFEETKNLPGVKLSLEWLEPYNLGQLVAFMQLSNQITEFLYNN